MEVFLKKMYEAQEELDARIQEEHDVTYANTRLKRILALLVELGELANETRCFKFWSLKGMSKKEIVLDEFADGLHFFLSLGITLKCQVEKIEVETTSNDLTEIFLSLYQKVSLLVDDFSSDNYFEAFKLFLSIILTLGYSSEDIYDAYFKKLQVNYDRQDHKY